MATAWEIALESTDKELVEASLRGDTSAFETLYRRYWRLAFGVAISLCSDKHFAEDGMFLDQDKYDALFDKPMRRWTEEERRIADIVKEAMLQSPHFPLMHYVRDHAVPGSFRYIGNGATLGEQDRIVCWYRLKDTNEYHAIHADLTVRKVQPDQLPLAVQSD